ncbi:MAG: hypothetical protein AUI53_07245 [Acidobacteria bacterium 13_1_40CM_2_60_7]|nr:MAG: hypothetical protein AUI53_07245 [Acidobacteria bacterium 13_1_40CM_2_60_7]OLE85542.1 MAG: hypothetical protein AUG07_04365 [Acidobacteria bacterium 13_1_20CM_2_60_10]
MLAQPQMEPSRLLGITVVVALLVLGAGIFLVKYLRRRFIGQQHADESAPAESARHTENPSAFMAASMQGVIQKLREQERELERLHRAEKERAEHTERVSEEVTRNMPAGLLLVNSSGIISNANPAAEQTLGMRGLAFRRFSEALGETSGLTRLLSECLASGKVFRREEVQHVTPGADVRLLGITISPVRRPGDKITGAICLLSDLTELTALQQEIQLKENLALLGELSAGMAHEFKNALATISGYAQMIRGEPNPRESSDYAEHILEQTRTITHVVTEFLKYAKPLDISDESVDLQPLVERVIGELQEAIPGVKVTAEGRFGQVSGDEGLLRQAILNIARNAAEAASDAPGTGRVFILGSVEAIGNNEVQQIRVVDSGPGISAAALEKMFRPFFTTKAHGTGLGLPVVQKIILQHGGRVEARNRPEGGAEFTVTLPISQVVAEAIESKQDRI